MEQKKTLNNYFEKKWKPNYDSKSYSGWKLIDKVKSTETILDIGCGYNLFKEHSEFNFFEVAHSAEEACKDSDAIIVLTEWEEFKTLDWRFIYKNMRKPAWVFDARAFLDKVYLKNIGFKVWTLGSS